MILDKSRMKYLDDAIQSLESELLKNLTITQSNLMENPIFTEYVSKTLPAVSQKLSELYLIKSGSETDVISSISYLEASISLQDEEPEYPSVIQIPVNPKIILTDSEIVFATRKIEIIIDEEHMQIIKNLIKNYKEMARDSFLEMYE